MRYTTGLIALILWLGLAAPARAAEQPLPFGPSNGYSLDKAGLKMVALALRAKTDLVRALTPKYADSLAIAPVQADAIQLTHGADHELRWIAKNLELPKNSDIELQSWTLGEGSPPPGLTALAKKKDRFRPGTTFWLVGYAANDGSKSMKLTPFVAGKDRWILWPLAQDILDNEEYPSDVVTLFVGLLQTGDYDTAYDFLGTNIQEQLTREEFPALMRRVGLHEMRTMQKAGSGRYSRVGRDFIHRRFDIERKDGQHLEVTIYAAHEGDEVRILRVDARTGFGLPGMSIYVPPADVTRDLAKRTIVLLLDAFVTGKIEPLLKASTKSLREEVTPARFREVFADYIKSAGKLAFLREGTVHWKARPFVKQDTSARTLRKNLLDEHPRGALVLLGKVISKDGTDELSFSLRFVFSLEVQGGAWLLQGVNLDLPTDKMPDASK